MYVCDSGRHIVTRSKDFTVKSVYNDHHWDPKIVLKGGRCSEVIDVVKV